MKIRHLLQDSYRGERDVTAAAMLSRLAQAGLTPPGVTNATPLSPAQRAAVNQALGETGAGNQPLKTWADAVAACLGDANGDEFTDLDLDTLLASGLFAVPQTERGRTTLSQAIRGKPPPALVAPALSPSSGDAFVSAVSREFASLNPVSAVVAIATPTAPQAPVFDPVGIIDTPVPACSLNANGSLVMGEAGPSTITAVALGVGDRSTLLQVETSAGRQTFALQGNGATKPAGLSASAVMQLVELAATQFPQPAPAGSRLATRLDALRAQANFVSSPQPTEPAVAAVWRASHLNPAAEEAHLKSLQVKYGVRPRRWSGYVDDRREIGVMNSVLAAAKTVPGIAPAFLFTIGVGEGLNTYFDATPDAVVDTSRPVSGFGDIGLDEFISMVPLLKAKQLLPADWTEGVQYTRARPIRNERGGDVASADFRDLDAGLTALAAVLGWCRQRFLHDAAQVLGAAAARALTPQQTNFFTYVYFNAGAGFGKKQLMAQGLEFFRPASPNATEDGRNARVNALIRIASLELLERNEVFPS